jgi:hypothetical protein
MEREAKVRKRRSETEIVEFIASEELSHYSDKIITPAHHFSAVAYSQ